MNTSKEKSIRDENNKSLTNKTISGLLWMFSGTGVQGILQFVVMIVLVRLVSPEEFGIINAALIIISFSSILTMLGVGPAIIQRSHLTETHVRTGFTISITLGLLLSLSLFIVAPIISSFFNMEELTIVLRVMTVIFLMQSFIVVAESLLKRELKFKIIARVLVLSYVSFGIIGISLALLGLGIWALILAHITQTAVKCAFTLYYQNQPIKLSFDYNAFKELMYFGTGFSIARISNQVALQGDQIVVGRVLGAEALGLYGRAYQLIVMPSVLFGQVLDKVLFPSMSKVQNDSTKLINGYKKGITIVGIVMLPISVVLYVLSPEVIHILLGSEWEKATAPFQILAIGMLFRTSYKISDSLVRAKGAVFRRAWRQVIYAICIITGSFIGGINWGLSGAAFGVLFALTINFGLMAQLSLNLTSMSFISFIKAHIPGLLIASIFLIQVHSISLFLRGLGISEFIIVIISVVSLVIPTVLVVKYFSDTILGKDGVWIIKKLVSHIKFN